MCYAPCTPIGEFTRRGVMFTGTGQAVHMWLPAGSYRILSEATYTDRDGRTGEMWRVWHVESDRVYLTAKAGFDVHA